MVAFVDFRRESWAKNQSLITVIGIKTVPRNSRQTPVFPDYVTADSFSAVGLNGTGLGYCGAVRDLKPKAISCDAIVGVYLEGNRTVVLGQSFRDYSQLLRKFGNLLGHCNLAGWSGTIAQRRAEFCGE